MENGPARAEPSVIWLARSGMRYRIWPFH